MLPSPQHLPSPAPRPQRRRRLAVAALAGALALAAGGFAVGAQDNSAGASARIVAVGGAITEVLYALGLQDKVVGVDTTSQWPPEALKEKKSVGYVRALSAEGVLSLRPTLVIAVEGAGPPDALALLRESGTPIADVPEAFTADAVVNKIAVIGKAAGAAERAQALAERVRAGFVALDAQRARLPARKRVLFVLSTQNGRTMVGGRNSTADGIIALAGGINAAAAVEGYKPMTDEAIINAAPDYILMMRHTAAHGSSADELFAAPAFSQTPAAKAKALIRMDGLYLLGFGPRTPDAARDLMGLLYPEAGIAVSDAGKAHAAP
jgi:iron complex transport system substrate-binding protein